MVEDMVILTLYTRALHFIILLKYQLNKNLDLGFGWGFFESFCLAVKRSMENCS